MVPVCVGSISRTSSNSPTNPEVPMKVMIKGFPKQFLPFPWHFFCVFCISNKGKAEQKGVLVEAAPAKGWASRREQSSFLHVEKRPLLCAFHFSGRNWCPLVFLSWADWVCPFPSHSSLGKHLLCISISYLQHPRFPVMHWLNAAEAGHHTQASPCLPHTPGPSLACREQSLLNWYLVTTRTAKTFQSSSSIFYYTGINNYNSEKKSSFLAGALKKGK